MAAFPATLSIPSGATLARWNAVPFGANVPQEATRIVPELRSNPRRDARKIGVWVTRTGGWQAIPEAEDGVAVHRRILAAADRDSHRFSTRLEGIQEAHVVACEVRYVPRHDRQSMNNRRCRDHRVLVERIRLPVHQPSPLAKRHAVHWQDVV